MSLVPLGGSIMDKSGSRSISPQLIAWCALAAIGGVCSLVLPPYLAKNGLHRPAYGSPLIPWFALAWTNVRVAMSMVWFFVLGLILGIAQPRWWLLLAGAAVALPPVLLAINILHDWTRDATAHNLFPFEYLMYAFICGPVFIGAVLGFLSRRLLQRPRQT
jgi:hypothetical protein